MQNEKEGILDNYKAFLAKGEVEIVLETLMKAKISENKVTVLFSRWNTLRDQSIIGTIETKEYNLEKNKIVHSTLELIKKIKTDSEEKSNERNQSKKPKSNIAFGILPEITNGSSLAGMIQASNARREPSTDSISNDSEANLIGDFLSEIKDYSEYTEFALEIDPKYRMQTELKMNNKIKELNENGFRVFGEIRKMLLVNSEIKLNTINICIIRADNEKIIKNDNGNLFLQVVYAN